jgi:hypothetical protein
LNGGQHANRNDNDEDTPRAGSAQRRRHTHTVRHAGRGEKPAGTGQVPVPARNRWQSGTLSETTIDTFSGAGGEHDHKTTFTVKADHPGVLVGEDRAPLPVEYLLHALASCITGGIANIAAARGVTLREVESTIEHINLLSIFGMSKDVATAIRASRRLSDRATRRPRSCRRLEQSRARSAVFDMLTGSVPVASVNAG